MAAAWQVRQSKRGRDDYWSGGFALPHRKRINGELTVVQDSDLLDSVEEINDLDAIDGNPEETDAGNELEIRINGVIQSLEDEIGLKVQTTSKIESSEEKGSVDEMGPFRQGELAEEGANSEATSACDIGEWTYYHDVHAELGCFVEDISPNNLGVIVDNYIDDGDSMANFMYCDPVHCYDETMEDFCGSLWEDDIWQLNENPAIRNDFESSQQAEVGLVISEAEFPALWNDIRLVQRLSDDEKAP